MFEVEGAARFECDDTDDDDRGVLEIFFGGNQDWYASMNWAEPNGRPPGPAVRFRTSGGSHPTTAILCIAILHDIGTGNAKSALHRAVALCDQLGPGSDPFDDAPLEKCGVCKTSNTEAIRGGLRWCSACGSLEDPVNLNTRVPESAVF